MSDITRYSRNNKIFATVLLMIKIIRHIIFQYLHFVEI